MADSHAPHDRKRGSGDLSRRVLSALIAAPLALAAVWQGTPWFEILVAAVLSLGAYEWNRLCGLTLRHGGGTVWFTLLSTLLVAAFAEPILALIVLAVGVAAAALQRGSGADPAKRGHWAAAGAFLLGATALAALYLRVRGADGAATILWLFGVVWAADIGAYFTGRAIGGPKLAPAISPGKTWSGFAGGMVLAVLVGGAGGWLKADTVSLPAFAVALVVALASVGGDLLESWVKRRFGVKDSGAIMPGHGGVLDRIDGLLTATPILAIIAALASGDPVTWQ